jgi:hypothetical protein
MVSRWLWGCEAPAGVAVATAAAVLATGALIATAPGAHAHLATVQTQRAAMGGDWTVTDGVAASCCYESLDGSGERTCDHYWLNGDFMGSDAAVSSPSPTTKPIPRPLPDDLSRRAR